MSEALPALDIGDHVEDRDSDGCESPMVVVGLPVERADEYEFDSGQAVADVNPDYPGDDPVVQVVFPEETAVDVRHLKRYAFPRSRLRRTVAIREEDT